MATKSHTATAKASNKRPSRPTKSASTPSSRKPKSKAPAPKPTEQKSKTSATNLNKRKPPHTRYTEAQLKVPQLNGIRPAGVQKPPNKKKGKQFVDDGQGMKTILALVMAEKEGNIESKMMRARQMEEIREARRAEAEKRAEGKKAGLEERKESIKQGKKKRRHTDGDAVAAKSSVLDSATKKPKKKVSFG